MSSVPPGGSYTPPPPPPPGPGAPGPGGGDIVYPAQPPKDPILILILNLLLFGIGYIVMGQKTKGIVAIIAFWVLGVATCGFGTIISVLYAVDGYMQAQQLQQGHPIGQWTWFGNHL
jgi:TM2 domain-containing membrane protein YozV